MSHIRSRSSSSDKNEDSVKRDQRSSSRADEDNSAMRTSSHSRTRSNSPAASKSKSRSKSRTRKKSGGSKRSNSRGRRSRSPRISKSKGRARTKSRSRSRSQQRQNDDGYRLHVAGKFFYQYIFKLQQGASIPHSVCLSMELIFLTSSMAPWKLIFGMQPAFDLTKRKNWKKFEVVFIAISELSNGTCF